MKSRHGPRRDIIFLRLGASGVLFDMPMNSSSCVLLGHKDFNKLLHAFHLCNNNTREQAQGKEHFRPRHIQPAGSAVHRKIKNPWCRLALTLSNLNIFDPEFSSIECFLDGSLLLSQLKVPFLDREKFQSKINLSHAHQKIRKKNIKHYREPQNW